MIVMDTPRWDTFRGRRIWTAHLVSTLLDEEGTAELLAFATRLGLKASWIQHQGEAKEHFDLMGGKVAEAEAAGAKVDRYALVNAIRTKRGQSLLEVVDA